MQLSQLDPQLRPIYRFVPNAPVTTRLGRAIARAALGRMKPPVVAAPLRAELVPMSSSTPDLHIIHPAVPSGAALLWIHGGGMVIGSVAQDYPKAIHLAARYGITVVLPEYRLAPEHPHPAPLDDCAAGWQWLVTHASELQVDPARLAVGGQSAGGGLAAALAQRLHDQGGAQPIAQWLFCPMLDDRTAGDRRLDKVKHILWNNRSNYAGWKALLGEEPGSTTVPDDAVPSRRDDLTDLPPAWIGTGTAELFHDEDVDYASRLIAAGVDTTLDEVPGAPHAFESVAAGTPLAQAYSTRAEAWLAARLGATTTTGAIA